MAGDWSLLGRAELRKPPGDFGRDAKWVVTMHSEAERTTEHDVGSTADDPPFEEATQVAREAAPARGLVGDVGEWAEMHDESGTFWQAQVD